jgi:hypothetical protein
MRHCCDMATSAVPWYNLHWLSPSGLLQHIGSLIEPVPGLVLKLSVECCATCTTYVNHSRMTYSVLCRIQVPYKPYLATQFSMAFDAYLEICRQVDKPINTSLGYNTHMSHLRRSCPWCFYNLEGEPELQFSCFVSIDGNNLLKCLGTSVCNTNDRLDSQTILLD